MSNHLNELIETNGDINNNSGLDDRSSAQTFTLLKQQSSRAICFDMGDIDGLKGMQLIQDLIFMPYQACWFEGFLDDEDGRIVYGVMLESYGESPSPVDGVRIHGNVYTKLRLGWKAKPTWHYTGWAQISGKAPLLSWSSSGGKVTDVHRYFIGCVGVFLSIMNCTNISTVCNKPDDKLQKARVKKGKQPLFSYWTLHLKGKKEKEQHQGGTHASPRVHLRRGHRRQYAPGKWAFVHGHAVGRTSLGMVHKDYALSPAP